MADDIARRREIRRRKILESSEARIKKIFNVNTNETLEKDPLRHEDSVASNRNYGEINQRNSSLEDDDFPVGDYEFASREKHTTENQSSKCTNRLLICDSQSSSSANGDFSSSSSFENYIFPKKVSAAETRSFGRTRSDVRRNSSCTQIMMETLQFSSFSLKLLRVWLAVVAAFVVKAYFLLSKNVPVFKTIFIPYVMLEIAFYSWSKFEPQLCSRPLASSIISGVLLICGLPSTAVSSFNSAWNSCQSLIIDLCVYLFSFVIFHLVFETCM
ncbi:guided entry of tail-anchored proteins factor CAMLG-like [Argiope bruennichi]|uniref:Calcium signal-modulating cyclophilin ligand n=1 Tax=Argiope bruennichi TaxID=94029 RepID=A0A8T0FV08_ARGBR|nr:guided entry of tail-anchored proteins factor CAMLG-like [Argiope bruennichi]KAF8794944.1 hypothetical protein HNY73_002854 [Argiope bruennichi]